MMMTVAARQITRTLKNRGIPVEGIAYQDLEDFARCYRTPAIESWLTPQRAESIRTWQRLKKAVSMMKSMKTGLEPYQWNRRFYYLYDHLMKHFVDHDITRNEMDALSRLVHSPYTLDTIIKRATFLHVKHLRYLEVAVNGEEPDWLKQEDVLMTKQLQSRKKQKISGRQVQLLLRKG